MKNTILRTIVNLFVSFAGIFILYILASFTSWDANVENWHPFVRFVYAIMAIVVGFRVFVTNP